MSLFGDSDAPSPQRPKSSLFDDDNTGAATSKTSSGMFGDSVVDDANDSPWGFTPKKSAGRGNVVKSLLADANIPDAYIDTFDTAQTGAGRVSADECRRLLAGARGLNSADQDRIWRLVSSNGELASLGRAEFNVLLALIGLVQEGEELSLDAVDERRRKLPIPVLPKVQSQGPPTTATQMPPHQTQPGATQAGAPAQTNGRKPSFGAGFGDADPWGSPQMHRGHGHANGIGSEAPQRTTSSFTTGASEPSQGAASGTFGNSEAAQSSDSTAWGGAPAFTAGGASGEGFGASGGAGGGGFGDDGNGAGTVRRPAPPRNTTSKGAEELVTVNILEEKEGMFMFQHRNYEVASNRRSSKVIRRYSDFVWLLDCLHKRYPFRQLPLLPPKRVAINGNHIAADQTFVEKRRRGLARFANALVRHPVLKEEQLVVMFLTVPTVDACAASLWSVGSILTLVTGTFRLA